MASIEIRRSRKSTSSSFREAQGILIYTCDSDAEMYALSFALLGTNVTFNPNFADMTVVETTEITRDPKRNNSARLEVTCRGAGHKHQPDKAYMTVESIPAARVQTTALDHTEEVPKIVSGSTFETLTGDEAKLHDEPIVQIHYEPKRAEQLIEHTGITKVTVYTAYRQSEISWDTINNLLYKVNDAAMPKLGAAQARELKLVAAGIPKYHLAGPESGIIPITYVFYKWPEDNGQWPLTVKVDRFTIVTKNEYIKMYDDGQTPPWGWQDRESGEWIEQSGANQVKAQYAAIKHKVQLGVVDRTVNAEGNFSALYGLLEW